MVHTRYKRGLTLIETLVWISVFAFAMTAVTASLLSFYRANTYTLEQAQAVSDARKGIETMVRTLRETAYASNGAYPVVSIDENEITVYSDVDKDVFVERVRFFLVGTELRRGVVEPSGSPLTYTGAETVTVISRNIRNLEQSVIAFRYYDEAGDEIIDHDEPSGTRFVTTNLVVNVSPDRLPNELTLRSSATLRNLQY